MYRNTLLLFLLSMILWVGLSVMPPTAQAQDVLEPPALQRPDDASYTNDLTPTLRWSRVRGADLYRVDLADNMAFSNPLLSDYEHRGRSLTLNNRSLGGELPPGTYYWRVQARTRGTDTWSAESAVFSFTVHLERSPRDASYTRSTRPTFRWMRSRDAIRYRLLVDDDADFSSPAIDSTTDHNRQTRFRPDADAPLPYALYYWRVDAEYTDGWYTSPVVFQVTIHTQQAPRDESLSRSTRPTFRWMRDRDALRYRLLIDNNADFSSPTVDLTTEDNRLTRFRPEPDAELPYDIYYWRVDTKYEDGWQINPVIFQVTITPRPLPRVRRATPANNTWSNDGTPTLTWEASVDPEGQPVTYEVQVSDRGNFHNLLAQTITSDTQFTVPSELPADGNIYWRVRAINWLDVPGSWSARWRIRLDREAPDSPELTSPDDNTGNLDGIFRFQWRGVRGAMGYEIQIGSGPIVDTGRSRRYTPETPLDPGDYTWHVRAYDRAGNASAWSVSWSIHVLEADEDIILAFVNQERCDRGLHPLALNDSLNAAALAHSQDMAENNFFDHEGSDGSNAGERISRQGYNWTSWAENIAAGYSTPQSVHNGWMNSSGHRANILSGNVREMGLARVYRAGTDWGTYWTQVFGNRSGAPQLTCGAIGLGRGGGLPVMPLAETPLGVIGLPASSDP